MTTAIPVPLAQRPQEPTMADFKRRTTIRTIEDFAVPTGPYGAPSDEIGKAWAAAEAHYRQARGLTHDAPVPGDAVRFVLGDDEIVLRITTEAQQ